MNLKLKYIVFFTGSLFLPHLTTTSDNNSSTVSTFSPDYIFETKLTALYLKPGATNTHFAAEAFPLPLLSPNWKIHDICKEYQPGFDLLFRTQIHKTDSCLFVNWERITTCDRTKAITDSDNMMGPFFEIGPDADAYYIADGSVKFNFNEINIDYGQNINFGDRLKTTIFIGASLVRICEILDYTYAGTHGDDDVSRNIKTPIKFEGAGPQFGIDFAYDIICGLEFMGRLSGALLNGKSHDHTTYTSYAPALVGLGSTNPNVQETTTKCISLIVPSLFQRVGLAYTYEFCDHYVVTAEIGYQAQIYFNAFKSTDLGSEVVTPPNDGTLGVYARTFQRCLSNFTLSGAYFSLLFAF